MSGLDSYEDKIRFAQEFNHNNAETYKALSCSVLKFATSIQQFSRSQLKDPIFVPQTQNQHDKNGNPIVVGSGGSLETAINSFDYSVVLFLQNLGKFGAEISENSISINKSFNFQTVQNVTDVSFQNAQLSVSKINSIHESISKQISSKDSHDLIISFLKMKAEIDKNPFSTPRIIRSHQKEINKLMQARSKSASQRAKFVSLAKASHQDFISNITSIACVCDQRTEALCQTLEGTSTGCLRFAQKIRESAKFLKETIDLINFPQDFKTFVTKQKIIRYDLPCKDFTPVDTSSAAFKDFKIEFNYAVSPLFPVAMGKVVNSFSATQGNEISVSSGKYILLMEENDMDWIYIMNPNSYARGFVPAWAVSKLPGRLGVITRLPKENELHLFQNNVQVRPGDYVLIVSINEDKPARCFTTFGESLSIPVDMLAIVSV